MVKQIPNCPSCGSSHTCEIVYGYPSDIEEYLKLVAEKKIHPAGCVSNEHSPAWHCNDCYHDWGEHNDLDKIDSIDFDQGYNLDDDLISKIKKELRLKASPRHVPSVILGVPDIPYTFSGKKVESAVTNIIHGREVTNRGALRNPESLDRFEELKEMLKG